MDTSQYIAQLAPIYDPQRSIIQQQRAQIEPQAQAQLSALEQAKINAFRDIGVAARSRGMQFSGFAPEQEARYLGATYLPAVASLKAKQQDSMTALDKALADIATNQQTQALNLYQTDVARKAQAEQWQKEFDWKAQQAALDRQIEREKLAIQRAAATAKTTSESELFAAAGTAFGPLLQAKIGADGHVSPVDYITVKNMATKSGLSSEQFDKIFASYVNPKYAYDYSPTYKWTDYFNKQDK